MEDKMRKPRCKLSGENGNIFNLLGKASVTLKSFGLIAEANEMWEKATSQNSYEDAIAVINEYVDAY